MNTRSMTACAAGAVALVFASAASPLRDGLPGHFVGAGEGTPIPFAVVTLPEVVVGPLNDHPRLVGPWAPLFEELATGHVLVTEPAQLRNIWRRCFAAPYDPRLVDFEQEFLVIAGSGLLHPWFGFAITNVESITAEFVGPEIFPDTYLEDGLAVVVTTELPGPPPPKMDPIYRIVAVAVPREHLAPAIVSRQIVALP